MTIDRKYLIELVNEIKDKNETDIDRVIQDDASSGADSKKVGTNQFRYLATVCRECESYEEIKLLIKYKAAKAGRDSWGYRKNTSVGQSARNFAEIIIGKLDRIMDKYKTGDGNDELPLEAMSLFFGYLYQSARVWKAESAEKSGKTDYSGKPDKNGGGNRDSQHGKPFYGKRNGGRR